MKNARVLFKALLVLAALVALNRCGTKDTAVFGQTTFFPNFTSETAK